MAESRSRRHRVGGICGASERQAGERVGRTASAADGGTRDRECCRHAMRATRREPARRKANMTTPNVEPPAWLMALAIALTMTRNLHAGGRESVSWQRIETNISVRWQSHRRFA